MSSSSNGMDWFKLIGQLGFGAVIAFILYANLERQDEREKLRDEKVHELMVGQSKLMLEQFKRLADQSEKDSQIVKQMAEEAKVRNDLVKQWLELERTNQIIMREFVTALKDRK